MGLRLAMRGADLGSLARLSKGLKNHQVAAQERRELTLWPQELQALVAHGDESLATTTTMVVESRQIPRH